MYNAALRLPGDWLSIELLTPHTTALYPTINGELSGLTCVHGTGRPRAFNLRIAHHDETPQGRAIRSLL